MKTDFKFNSFSIPIRLFFQLFYSRKTEKSKQKFFISESREGELSIY